MKRLALILIPIFLILSIGITVYLIMTQKKKETEIPKEESITLSPTLTQAQRITPLVTPIISPTITLTPVPTKITPTLSTNQTPLCNQLSASPSGGLKPLTVQFTGIATDEDGIIQKFNFNYGDGYEQTIEKKFEKTGTLKIEHTYTNSGSFTATLKIQDNNGDWSDTTKNCTVNILVQDNSPTATPKINSPKGGVSSLTPSPSVPISTPSATPTKIASTSPTLVVPDVPVAGNFNLTLIIGIGGLLVTLFGLLLAI